MSTSVIQQLSEFTWDFDESLIREYAGFMNGYLKCSAAWAVRLDVKHLWPFFDVAACLLPAVELPDSWADSLDRAFAGVSLHPVVKRTCVWSARWSCLEHSHPDSVVHRDLPAPYDDLLAMYARGGSFSTEHGFINLGFVGIPYATRGIAAYL